MPTPVEINNHSDTAISRLTQHFRDKRLINALFRSKSTARIDVLRAEADTYWISINGVVYTFSGATFIYDSPEYLSVSEIATGLVDAVNGATAESFELFTVGQEFGGEGVHGIWVPDANGAPGVNYGGFIIEDAEARQGLQGIRTDFIQGLPISSGQPQPLFAAHIFNYIGIDNDDQIGNIWFKIPTTFPGPSFKAQSAVIGNQFIWANVNIGILAQLYYIDAAPYIFKLEIGYFGQAPLLSYTIPEAYLVDGEWHSLAFNWDRSGTYISIDLDSGAYGGSTSSGLSPTGATQIFILTCVSDSISTPISDVPDIYYDNLELGQEIIGDAVAKKLDEADDYLYLASKTTGDEIGIGVSNNLAIKRLGTIDQVQEIEDVLFQLLNERSLTDAEGVQLDLIGEILGLARQGGWTDDEYRILLGVRIGINLSNGEPERMINTLDALVESNFVKLTELFPAAVDMRFDGVPVNETLIVQQMNQVKPVGVKLKLIKTDPINPFATEGFGGNGFGDVENPGLGGIWSWVIE